MSEHPTPVVPCSPSAAYEAAKLRKALRKPGYRFVPRADSMPTIPVPGPTYENGNPCTTDGCDHVDCDATRELEERREEALWREENRRLDAWRDRW
jgi:hypothetical protein